MIPPCKLPYVIYSLDKNFPPIDGVIDIPDLTILDHSRKFSASSLSTDYMVEVNELTSANLVVRFFVYNKEHYNLRIYVTDRGLECQNATQAKWSLHGGPLQWESVGPQFVLSQRWVVFVSAIDLEGDKRPTDCTGWLELSSQDEIGNMVPIKTVKFSLAPTGIYSTLDSHGRPTGSLKQRIIDSQEIKK